MNQEQLDEIEGTLERIESELLIIKEKQTAKHNKDYTGGSNHFTTLERFADSTERLTN